MMNFLCKNQIKKITLETGKLRQYFPRGTTPREMEETIFYLLEEHANIFEILIFS